MSDLAPRSGRIWRLVEAQHRVSTAKLTDTPDEQYLLEDLVETAKPPIPPDCRHLHYLLAAPFRYGGRYPSRFRRAGATPGLYYASEHVETAVAEVSFHRLIRLGDSPDLPWGRNPLEFSAFAINYTTDKAADITGHPDPKLRDPVDYSACQSFADTVRAAGAQAIRSTSVRDPKSRANVTILNCVAFVSKKPLAMHTWRLRFSSTGVQAMTDDGALHFDRAAFAADPRIADYPWERPAL